MTPTQRALALCREWYGRDLWWYLGDTYRAECVRRVEAGATTAAELFRVEVKADGWRLRQP